MTDERLLDGITSLPPTPEPTLAADIEAFFHRYVILAPEQAVALVLWTIHTHAIEAANFTPYINVFSAEKQSGKTRTLETAAALCAKPWLTARASAAALVRKIAKDAPTLLLDETDAGFKGSEEYRETLRGILNAGFQRDGVHTMCVGKNHEVADFPVFCAKMLAGIGRALPETVVDRAVSIELKRRLRTEPVARFRRRKIEPEAAALRERIAAWALQAVPHLLDFEPELPDELADRAQDVWEPLLAIADALGPPWPQRARTAAAALSSGVDATESTGVVLLTDIRTMFSERDVDRMTSEELVRDLAAKETSPWGPRFGKPFDARALARLLKPYRIKPDSIRTPDGRTPKGYLKAWFADAWTRYLPPDADNLARVAADVADNGAGKTSHTSNVALVAHVAPNTREMEGNASHTLSLTEYEVDRLFGVD
jgi:hypothetical protein